MIVDIFEAPGRDYWSEFRQYKRSREGLLQISCRVLVAFNLDITCDYHEPPWWRSLAARDIHKERIKRQIRHSKVIARQKNLQAFVNRTLSGPKRKRARSRSPSVDASSSGEYTPYLNAPAQPQFESAIDEGQNPWQHPIPSTSYSTLMGGQRLPGQLPLPEMSNTLSQQFPHLGSTLQLYHQLPLESPQQWLSQPLHTPTFPVLQPFPEPVTQQFSPLEPQLFQESSTQQYLQQAPQQLPQQVSEQYTGQQYRPLLPAPSSTQSSSLTESSGSQKTTGLENTLTSQKPLSEYLETITVKAAEKPLLHHFVDNVLKLIFPVLDLHPQMAPRSQEILQSLENNKPFFHCSLSVSALHIKTVKASTSFRTEAKIIDDIMRHRYASVSDLCDALNADEHQKVLDATLATILFHCAVGEPEDYLPDIPWFKHFRPVADLVHQLGLIEPAPFTPLPFSMSLTTWIDILGATMLGRSPQFSHVYRTKHSEGISSGMRDIMGCDDSVMYLISEIGCLESLKLNGLGEDALQFHISALTSQLDNTDTEPTANPCSRYGIICPEKLTANITAVFRAAARVYLSTLAPGFERSNPSVATLVQGVVEALYSVPMGPHGYDRSLVWPLLMAGVCSTPESEFRKILAHRASELDDGGEYGSFGRMYRVLKETWKLADDPTTSVYDEVNYMLPSMNTMLEGLDNVPPPTIGSIGRPIKKQAVHWRSVMFRHGWYWLLL
ncbi:transcriptional regulator family: Fungal Specific TF [Aspergillus niger]|nr:transcriptional regulator family: Fungal Specific TF [Aspergillus niger]KAI2864157.1 transcriptional regulator family: Fungal Specific TF [Aspergillus niger]KAI3022331.1 transcriptional regulator family: Fungal Specific TF [Aspergillus niger]